MFRSLEVKTRLTTINRFSSELSFLSKLKYIKDNELSIVPFCPFPVGYIYVSIKLVDPSLLFGGTWEPLNEGRALISANDKYPVGSKGGEAQHILTESEMASHSHSGSTSSTGSHYHGSAWGNGTWSGKYGIHSYSTKFGNTSYDSDNDEYATSSNGSHSHSVSLYSNGGGGAHNNMQPYLSVYMWYRVK